MQMYHFVTEWLFDFPIKAVWQELGDFRSFPEWWSDWKKLELRGDESEPQVGSIFDCEVKGSLPYTLRYSLEIMVSNPPYLNEHLASGGLVGSGKWVLTEQDGGTQVEHYWHVGTSNPVLNAFGTIPYVRKMMEKNHTEVMERGYQGLKARLEKKTTKRK